MKNLSFYMEIQVNNYKIIELKEKMIVQYILDIDLKGFLFKLKNIENITNNIFELKNAKCIEKL